MSYKMLSLEFDLASGNKTLQPKQHRNNALTGHILQYHSYSPSCQPCA